MATMCSLFYREKHGGKYIFYKILHIASDYSSPEALESLNFGVELPSRFTN